MLDSTGPNTDFWARLAERLPEIRARAPERDRNADYPAMEMEMLANVGLLAATLPPNYGGLGFGMAGQSAELATLLYQLGHASLPIARLYEAHVNALQLVFHYGNGTQKLRAAEDSLHGRLFALWVTDPPHGEALRLKGNLLLGGKAFCSAAGWAKRALVTAHAPEGIRMLVLSTENAKVTRGNIALSGMRAAITGEMDFSNVAVEPDALLGAPDDYQREPVFSAGAWRGSAAALGGLGALLGVTRRDLRHRQRDTAPAQRARFGQLAIAHEGARLWVGQAGETACALDEPSEAVVASVNLARIAVEQYCLEAIQLSQRALGLSAFMAGSDAERINRDLAAYLRQPAPDEVLDIAAAHFFDKRLPGEWQ